MSISANLTDVRTMEQANTVLHCGCNNTGTSTQRLIPRYLGAIPGEDDPFNITVPCQRLETESWQARWPSLLPSLRAPCQLAGSGAERLVWSVRWVLPHVEVDTSKTGRLHSQNDDTAPHTCRESVGGAWHRFNRKIRYGRHIVASMVKNDPQRA